LGRLRSAFLLHHYAGFEAREVAEMLGRPEGTIKADLHHFRISRAGKREHECLPSTHRVCVGTVGQPNCE
jgi:DNA-directed RNA polymerase specialized sigma24 family protein